MGAFGEVAPAYFAAGLNVMPVRGKKAFLAAWATWCQQKIPPETQAEWLAKFGQYNIGLPLGSANGLVAVDIDTDDPQVLAVFDRVLPKSPWKRRGQKGFVMLFRHTDERTFHLYELDPNGERKKKPTLDFLSTGSQVVLPPSIHPDILQPYTANCELLDVLDRIPALPSNFEDLIRQGLLGIGRTLAESGTSRVGSGNRIKLSDRISQGFRDNTLTRQAGFFAYDVLMGKMGLREALSLMKAWAEDQIDKTWGDEIDSDKGVSKIIEFILKDVLGPKQKPLPPGWDDGLTDEDKVALGLGDITDANRMLSPNELQLWVTEVKEAGYFHKDHEKYVETIDKFVRDVARNTQLSSLEEDILLQKVQDCTGKGVRVSSMRKQINSLRRGAVEGADHSSIANAVIEELSRTGELRFWNSILWQWVGSHWSPVEESTIIKLISNEFGGKQAAKRYSDHMGIVKLIRNLVCKPLAPDDIAGINFVNGFLTEDLQLVDHAPDFGATYTLPYAYQPELVGKATRWIDMLLTYWDGDIDIGEKMTALQEAMGATLFGRAPSMGRAICLYGVAAAGKSQIIKIMEGLLPESVRDAIPPTEWIDKFARAELSKPLLNVCGDLSDSKYIDGSFFKSIVTGETISAQYKFEANFQFRPRAAHWFATNHLPKSRDSSEGFSRRWLFLRFDKPMPMHKRVTDYSDVVLSEEREAIAAWAVQGWVQLRERNASTYTLPASAKKFEKELEHRINTVRFFIDTLISQGRLVLGGEDAMPMTQLYNVYKTFCLAEVAVQQVNLQTFSDYITQMAGRDGYPYSVGVQPSGMGDGVVTAISGMTLSERAKLRKVG